MTKTLSSIAFAMLTLICITTISCNDDEYGALCNEHKDIDYTLEASGSVTVSDINGNLLYVAMVKDAGYCMWTTSYDMSDATISFMAFLSPQNVLNTSKKLTRISLDPPAGEHFKIGKISDTGELSFSYYEYDRHGYIEIKSVLTWFTGIVTIVSFEPNKYITLKFSDCKSTSPEVIFNGEIKFPIRQRTSYWNI